MRRSWSLLFLVGIFLFAGIFYLSLFASTQQTYARACTGGGKLACKAGCTAAAVACYFVPLCALVWGGVVYNSVSQCYTDCDNLCNPPPAISTCDSYGGICTYPGNGTCGSAMSLSGGDAWCVQNYGTAGSKCCTPYYNCYDYGGTCVNSCTPDVGTVLPYNEGATYCGQVSHGYAPICCKPVGSSGPPPGPPPPPPPPRYNIYGSIFVDTNRDGVMDNGEQYYTGSITVSLSGAGSGSTDASSGQAGPYAFYGNLTGTYTVSLPTIPANYDATTPTSQTFYLGADRYNVNFGIVPYFSISGNVFNDLNKDRIKDLIDPNTNPVMEPNITSGIHITTSGGTVTNPGDGTWTIPHLYEGQYTITYDSAIPASYFMIYPLNGNPSPYYNIYVGPNCFQNANLSFGSTCGGNLNGSAQNVNFAISNSIPWFQSYGLNMREDEGFEDKIPANPDYPRYASVADNANGASNLITPTFTPTPTPTFTPVLVTGPQTLPSHNGSGPYYVYVNGLTPGANYSVVVNGTYEYQQYTNTSLTDPQWDDWQQSHNCFCRRINKVVINGGVPNAIDYQSSSNPAHTYTFVVTQPSSQMQLYIPDDAPYYSDNLGNFTFWVYTHQ